MKTQYILSTVIALVIAHFSFAQNTVKTDTIAVNGNCGSCKKNIETAAKSAGAAYAIWNKDTKQLVVKYAATTTALKIEQAVAAKGYDTKDVKATEAAYKKLDECCQYRKASVASSSCCSNSSCNKTVCAKSSCCTNAITKKNNCSSSDCCSKK